ncbi:Gfo/Idh/MocA family protein [Allomuricauda sp. CP2A]|jgi:predicted dehydrogenase|uniref:Gfo/Idh/MocA family protein n=1 Tax=Allomuricauda sp. CP2A TaxID=1848189 RepID=UPI0008337B02|nr:Gfo/Idh/MocA family oxidoreductase [Muricauda sp. CP2A]
MKVLIVGFGSIAKKHVYVLREIDPKVEIFALRSSKKAGHNPGIRNLFDWDKLKEHKFHFIIIASPSSLHLEHIIKLAELGKPIMIEKPMLINRDQISTFENMGKLNVPMYVACNFRFHPAIIFLKKHLEMDKSKVNEVNAYCGSYLPNWRPSMDYRMVYSSRADMGGGVHIDLIHEPDYLIYLFGMPNNSKINNRKVSNLEISSIDSSNILFQYEGFQAQIVLNYYRKDPKRTLEIVREKDTLFVDFLQSKVYDICNNKLLFEEQNPSIFSSYKEQLLYFLNCLDNGIQPMNSPSEAIEVLKYIL